MSRGNAKLEVGQLVLTSSTPPADSGFYKIDETTMGVVGDLKFRHPKTGAMSSALTVTSNSAQGVGFMFGGTPASIPLVFAITSIPFFVPPGDGGGNGLSFNEGGTGAFTLSSAVSVGLGAGLSECYVWIPSNSGGSGNQAGWYYATMSSDTTGVVYGNRYTSGLPELPDSPIPFSGAPSGRITQTISEVVALDGINVPVALGKNGAIELKSKIIADSSATTKSFRAKLNGVTVAVDQPSTVSNSERVFEVRNAGRTNRQICSRASSGVGVASSSVLLDFGASIDTSGNNTLSTTLQVSANTSGVVQLSVRATVFSKG